MRPPLWRPSQVNFTKHPPSVPVNPPFIARDKRRLLQSLPGIRLSLSHAARQSGEKRVAWTPIIPSVSWCPSMLECHTILSSPRNTLQVFTPQHKHALLSLPVLYWDVFLWNFAVVLWLKTCVKWRSVRAAICRNKRRQSAVTEGVR
jgi:hypothetical protein